MSLANAIARFNVQAFRVRRQAFGVLVTTPGFDSGRAQRPILAAKTPTRLTRQPQEMGAGYIERAEAVFRFPASGLYVPQLGADFTLSASKTAGEVGTVWRCYQLHLANPGTGSDHICHCFRLD